MMRPSPELTEVYLCVEPVDFRKGIDGLAAIVEMAFGLFPMSPALFVFGNRRRDRVRILYWERNGFCLWQKRLEAERFHWLRSSGTHTSPDLEPFDYLRHLFDRLPHAQTVDDFDALLPWNQIQETSATP